MKKTSVRSLMCRVRMAQPVVASSAAGAAAALLVVAAPCPAAFPPSAEGRTMAVATDSADATRAAVDVMSAGGNAVDGAVAAALALGVVSPAASGIGGGGFALVYSAKDKKVRAFDFREVAPAKFSSEILWPPPKPGEPPKKDRFTWTGPNGGVVGVPGEPAGLELLSTKLGRKSLADAAAPAVRLASNGFYVSKHLADVLKLVKPRLESAPPLASTFLPGGSPAGFGVRVRRPELAATLSRFGAQGRRSIYEGATAQKIVTAVTSAGGTMTLDDLSGYSVKERAPLVRTVDGREIHTMPAPSAGGLMVLETLMMFGASPSSSLVPMGFGSSAYLHMLAEAMRGAYADRVRLAGDPDIEAGVDAAYAAALEPAQIAARKARIEATKTHVAQEFRTRESGTSHLVVADTEGNVVSLTTTVNGPFGASIVAGDTGIVLNNELDDFSTIEDVRGFAVVGAGPNRPRPKARPVSSMSPTIILEQGAPILAVGGSGGTRIATGTTQAVLARLLFDLEPTACVAHPRIHVQGPDVLVDKEIPVDVRDGLRARGEAVKDEPFQGSGVQMIAWSRSNGLRLLAASDPRKGGFAAAR